MTGPLVATYNGNGPFVPVICWKEGRYVCGPALTEAEDALRFAVAYAEAIRDALRGDAPEGHRW